MLEWLPRLNPQERLTATRLVLDKVDARLIHLERKRQPPVFHSAKVDIKRAPENSIVVHCLIDPQWPKSA